MKWLIMVLFFLYSSVSHAMQGETASTLVEKVKETKTKKVPYHPKRKLLHHRKNSQDDSVLYLRDKKNITKVVRLYNAGTPFPQIEVDELPFNKKTRKKGLRRLKKVKNERPNKEREGSESNSFSETSSLHTYNSKSLGSLLEDKNIKEAYDNFLKSVHTILPSQASDFFQTRFNNLLLNTLTSEENAIQVHDESTRRKDTITIRVGSIDGGGGRGLIPAKVLKKLAKTTKLDIHKIFDLMAGTSTGGILSLTHASPKITHGQLIKQPRFAPQDIVKWYEEDGSIIFRENCKGLGGINGPRYDRTHLDKLLEERVGDLYMKDLLTEVVITGYDLRTGKMRLYTRDQARKDDEYNIKVSEVAKRTSAAPTYFETVDGHYIDGGVGANNPVSAGIAKARHKGLEILRQLKEKRLEDYNLKFEVYSFGTGSTIKPIEGSENFGFVGWAKNMVGIFMQSHTSYEEEIMKLLKNCGEEGDFCYERIQIDLPRGYTEMDDHSPKTLKMWAAKAEELCESEAFENIVRRIDGQPKMGLFEMDILEDIS